ncbi:MAG TPA: hypothetical protein VHY10_10075 [Xanthobacteraceae bacterium]|jgi:hypothetical protein|nr:hypothetical protein [Xanthobacteraceae bacterium]
MTQHSDSPRAFPWLTGALPAVLLFAVGLGFAVLPFSTGNMIPGQAPDPAFNRMMLEYFTRGLTALVHGHGFDFLNVPIFYPWPDVTNFSDTHWGDGLPYALARALGADDFRAFQIWFIVGFPLTYVSTLWSLRLFGLGYLGSAAGAFLFTFNLPEVAHYDHAQMLYRLWVPPAVLALEWFLTRRSLKAGAACILFVALQFAATIYLGLFLVLLLSSYAVAAAMVGRHRLALPRLIELRAASASAKIATGSMLIAGLGVLAVVAVPYIEVQRLYGFSRPWSEAAMMMPHLSVYLLTGHSLIWPNLSVWLAPSWFYEQQIFPGLAALVPVIWFLIDKPARRRNMLVPITLVTVAIMTGMTLDFEGVSLYRAINWAPGFSALRAIARVVLVTMFPLSVLLGLLIDNLIAAKPSAMAPWRRQSVGVLLVGLLVAEGCAIKPFTSTIDFWRTAETAVAVKLPASLPPSAILAATGWQLIPALVAVKLGIRTLDGYSGNIPPDWHEIATCDDVDHDLRAGQRFLVEHGRSPPKISPDKIVLIGLGACDRNAFLRDPPLAFNHVYRFGNGGDGDKFMGDGFSVQEDWGRWTVGNAAYLYFSLPAAPKHALTFAVTAMGFSPASDHRQDIAVDANGDDCGTFSVANGREQAEIVCPVVAFHAHSNALRLRIANPARPSDVGHSTDERELGLGLKSLTVMTATCRDRDCASAVSSP